MSERVEAVEYEIKRSGGARMSRTEAHKGGEGEADELCVDLCCLRSDSVKRTKSRGTIVFFCVLHELYLM